jgi:hypothetical protein
MKKLLLSSILVLSVIFSSSVAVAAEKSDSTIENAEPSVELTLTTDNIVKEMSPEEYFKFEAKEKGISVEKVRVREMKKLEEYNKQYGDGKLRLGDYHYSWLNGNIPFIDNSKVKGNINISVRVYCFGDRIVNVVDGSETFGIGDGSSVFEITTGKVYATKKSDYKVIMDGRIQVRTVNQIGGGVALNLGLPEAGFTINGSGSQNSYYYKWVTIYKQL